MQFWVQRSSQNCYLTPKKCSQGHEIFFGHHQQAAGYPTILTIVRLLVRKLTILGFLANFTMGK